MTNDQAPMTNVNSARGTQRSQIRRVTVIGHWCLVIGYLFVVCALSGCDRGGSSGKPLGGAGAGPAGQPQRWRDELFTYAIDNLNRLEEFAPGAMLPQVVERLNQWAPAQELPTDWHRDPMLVQLPEALAKQPALGELDELTFTMADAESLQESVWLREAAGWARGSQHDELDRAQRLFDWTIRNIQHELVPIVDGKELGYLPQSPWETLLCGRGSPSDRAWVFIRMARQQGMDAALLALPGPAERPAEVTPWALAVRVGKEAYLFDPLLGMPIPAPGGIKLTPSGLSIQPATLAQVAADEKLLRQLDGDANSPYPFKREQIKSLVALVEATPAALSKRMLLVQSHLAGKQKTVVTAQPSAEAERWKQVPQVSSARLWVYAFESLWRRGRLSQIDVQRKVAMLAPFDTVVPMPAGKRDNNTEKFIPVNALWKGRLLHLRGVLGGEESAAYYYQFTRPSDQQLTEGDAQMAQLFFDAEARQNPRMPAAEIKQRAMQRAHAQTALLLTGKHHASYWLGLIQFEKNNYRGAIDYFSRRTLEAVAGSPWIPGARYNLARSYEASGDLEKAVGLYAESAKQFGDLGQLLRARWIDAARPRPATAKPAETKPPEGKPAESKPAETKKGPANKSTPSPKPMP